MKNKSKIDWDLWGPFLVALFIAVGIPFLFWSSVFVAIWKYIFS